ncbi:MAG: hypothetical protein ACREXG_04650 [Polaromonas sp.]
MRLQDRLRPIAMLSWAAAGLKISSLVPVVAQHGKAISWCLCPRWLN